MKSFKVTIDACSYPLFIDENLLSRLGEFCDLYRLPGKRILLSTLPQKQLQKEYSFPLSGFDYLPVQSESPNLDLHLLTQIFDQLPWEDFDKGITIAVVGEDWLIHSISLAVQISAFPVSLISIPTTLWSMLEVGVNDFAFLNWKRQFSVLRANYCPKLVILDVNFLPTRDVDERLLAIAVVLRHLLLMKPELFQLFQAGMPEVISDRPRENIQVVEELISSRLGLFQQEEDRRCLKDFGIRFLNYYRSRHEALLSAREFARVVLLDICWRWKVGKELGFSDPAATDSIFSLIEKICLKYGIDSQEWNRSKQRVGAMLSSRLLNDIYLPESIGHMKRLRSIDLELARRCLERC